MTRLHKYMTAAALLAVMPLCAMAQTNGSNSPYSRYGMGLLSDGGNAFNKGMSGTAYGMRYGSELNTKNPASYAAIDSLSMLFDFGVSLQNGNFSQQGVKTNAKNTSVDYITAGMRMAPRLGLSLGLVPFSTIGYESAYTQNISGSNLTQREQTTTYTGDGGLHEVYVGIGWAPIKPLSVGFNAGYLWGDLTHTSVMTPSEGYVNHQEYDADIRTYKVDFGLQYEQRINKKNTLTLGLVYGLGHDINRTANYYNLYLQSSTSSTVVSGDTLSCKNAFQLPHSVGVGLTWTYKNSLRVGADYTFQKWSNAKYPSVVRKDRTVLRPSQSKPRCGIHPQRQWSPLASARALSCRCGILYSLYKGRRTGWSERLYGQPRCGIAHRQSLQQSHIYQLLSSV